MVSIVDLSSMPMFPLFGWKVEEPEGSRQGLATGFCALPDDRIEDRIRQAVGHCCHPERNEGSGARSNGVLWNWREVLRSAQDDNERQTEPRMKSRQGMKVAARIE
jgi:hypothetical protein